MKLPDSVQQIADVIGAEKALFLIGKLPRCYVEGRSSGIVRKKVMFERVMLYVPKKLPIDHPLIAMLGFVDASKLVSHFPGEILRLANCKHLYKDFRDSNIARLLSEGLPVSLLAHWFDVSERLIKNIAVEKQQVDIKNQSINNVQDPLITTDKPLKNDTAKHGKHRDSRSEKSAAAHARFA